MMEIVVAGAFALLSAFAGISAFALLHNRLDEEKAKQNISGRVKAFASAISAAIKSLRIGQWLLIAAASILIGAAAYRLQSMELRILASGRLLTTALLLLPAMIIDWRTHRIPNKLILALLILGAVFLALEFFLSRELFREQIISCVVGLLGCLVLFYLLARITKEGIGMGDVKLIAAQGWMVGAVVTLTATLFGLLLCSVTAAVLLLSKKKSANDQVPFGPFVFLGYMLAILICNL